jgi:arsenical pump membrane protein
MVPVNMASVAASLVVLLLVFRKEIPTTYDPGQLKLPAAAIRDAATFKTAGWCGCCCSWASLGWSHWGFR